MLDLSVLDPQTRVWIEGVREVGVHGEAAHALSCQWVGSKPVVTMISTWDLSEKRIEWCCEKHFPDKDRLAAVRTLRAVEDRVDRLVAPGVLRTLRERVAVRLEDTALAPLGDEVHGILDTLEERAARWIEEFGDGALDLYSTALADREFANWRPLRSHLGMHDHTSAPANLEKLTALKVHPAFTDGHSAFLEAHRTRVRPEGRVLVHVQVAIELAVRNSFVQEALQRYALDGRRDVLVLPRAYEPLARRMEECSVAVLRGSDTRGVLETAAVLLRDRFGSAAVALKAARALA